MMLEFLGNLMGHSKITLPEEERRKHFKLVTRSDNDRTGCPKKVMPPQKKKNYRKFLNYFNKFGAKKRPCSENLFGGGLDQKRTHANKGGGLIKKWEDKSRFFYKSKKNIHGRLILICFNTLKLKYIAYLSIPSSVCKLVYDVKHHLSTKMYVVVCHKRK